MPWPLKPGVDGYVRGDWGGERERERERERESEREREKRSALYKIIPVLVNPSPETGVK